jgi:hypothetical protein
MTRTDAEILTVEDLAKLCSCDKETAAARLTCGDLPGVKVGRGWIIPRQALFERLNEKAKEEAAERRKQHAGLLNAAYRLEMDFNPSAHNKTPKNSKVSIPYLVSPATGRKRRKPPVLPPLPG